MLEWHEREEYLKRAPFWAVHTQPDPSRDLIDTVVLTPSTVARVAKERGITNRAAAYALAKSEGDPVNDPDGLVAAQWPIDVARLLERAGSENH